MSKLKSKISWREKINKITETKIVDLPDNVPSHFGKGKMLIPRPIDIETIVRKESKGKLITKSQLRSKLAEDAGTDTACPLTTGIFLRMVSEAAEEDALAGKKNIAPYWRVIGEKGELNEKFPLGMEGQAQRLEAEGVRIEAKKRSGKLVAIDFEEKLVKLS